MTEQDRQAIVLSAFTAIRRLVPKRWSDELEQHLDAAAAAFNDQSVAAFQNGRASGADGADDAYRRGKADGMLAVEARQDRRDLEDVEDAPELRSVH